AISVPPNGDRRRVQAREHSPPDSAPAVYGCGLVEDLPVSEALPVAVVRPGAASVGPALVTDRGLIPVGEAVRTEPEELGQVRAGPLQGRPVGRADTVAREVRGHVEAGRRGRHRGVEVALLVTTEAAEGVPDVLASVTRPLVRGEGTGDGHEPAVGAAVGTVHDLVGVPGARNLAGAVRRAGQSLGGELDGT